MQSWRLVITPPGQAAHSAGRQISVFLRDQGAESLGESALVAATPAHGALARGGCRHILSQQILWRSNAVEVDSLQELRILGLLEVLQVAEVGHKLGLLVQFLRCQKIEILGICKTLHELGAC